MSRTEASKVCSDAGVTAEPDSRCHKTYRRHAYVASVTSLWNHGYEKD